MFPPSCLIFAQGAFPRHAHPDAWRWFSVCLGASESSRSTFEAMYPLSCQSAENPGFSNEEEAEEEPGPEEVREKRPGFPIIPATLRTDLPPHLKSLFLVPGVVKGPAP